MVSLLLAGQLFQVFWAWIHPRIWVPIDAECFAENGSKDTLLQGFHAKRGRARGVLIGVVAVFAAAGIGWNWLLLPLVVGNVALQGGYWLWYFNPALNLARKLAYVSEFYVSWNPNGSRLDVYIWNRAWRKVRLPGELTAPNGPDPRVIAVAGPLYKRFLQLALLTGVVVYAVCLSVALWVKYL